LSYVIGRKAHPAARSVILSESRPWLFGGESTNHCNQEAALSQLQSMIGALIAYCILHRLLANVVVGTKARFLGDGARVGMKWLGRLVKAGNWHEERRPFCL
jgi:hypothetical protein